MTSRSMRSEVARVKVFVFLLNFQNLSKYIKYCLFYHIWCLWPQFWVTWPLWPHCHGPVHSKWPKCSKHEFLQNCSKSAQNGSCMSKNKHEIGFEVIWGHSHGPLHFSDFWTNFKLSTLARGKVTKFDHRILDSLPNKIYRVSWPQGQWGQRSTGSKFLYFCSI